MTTRRAISITTGSTRRVRAEFLDGVVVRHKLKRNGSGSVMFNGPRHGPFPGATTRWTNTRFREELWFGELADARPVLGIVDVVQRGTFG